MDDMLRWTVLPLGLCAVTIYVSMGVGFLACRYIYLSCAQRTLKDVKTAPHRQFLPPVATFSCTACLRRLFGPMPPSRLRAWMDLEHDRAI